MKQKILSLLVLLMTVASGAWAQWTGGTYTATESELNWNSVNVTDDATLTINQGVEVMRGSITISAGKKLTVVGPGQLQVKGAITGSGTIIVKGNASLLVYGTDGAYGAPGFNGSNGGDGAAAIMCSITIYSGSIRAYGGAGGDGGEGDEESGTGGDGGNGAPAFAGSGTLTYYGGSIEAFGGSAGNGGDGHHYGNGGAEAIAFADTYNVVFENQPTSIQDASNNPIDINNIKGAWYFKILGDDNEPEPDVEVTTNAASEQDLFTEASFKMPAFDATVNYMLVRDMQDQTNKVTFKGLPTGDGLIVKKGSDGKYKFGTDPTFKLTDPLADNADIIAATGLTVTVEKKNANNNFENSSTLADFLADAQPGTYRLKATATDENSPYEGTVTSGEFTLIEQYDLTVKPADEYSKGKIENVTVGSEPVNIDANGEATKTGIAPDTDVKIKAKPGYIIEKVEVKKGGKPVATLTTAPVPSGECYVDDDLLQTLGTAEGGTLMYKMTKTNVTPETTEGFSTDNPTGVENSGGNFKNYIWYYIKGDENHSDSEIFGPIEVNVWVS